MKKETGAEKEGGNLKKKKRRNKANKAYGIKKKKKERQRCNSFAVFIRKKV